MQSRGPTRGPVGRWQGRPTGDQAGDLESLAEQRFQWGFSGIRQDVGGYD